MTPTGIEAAAGQSPGEFRDRSDRFTDDGRGLPARARIDIRKGKAFPSRIDRQSITALVRFSKVARMRGSMHFAHLSRRRQWFAAALLPAAMLSLPGVALAVDLPGEALGTWARKCSDAGSPRIVIGNTRVSVSLNGKVLNYTGVDISYTWYGGIKATGDKVWVLVSKRPEQYFEFIVEVPMTGSKRAIKLEEGADGHGREVRKLFGKRFARCS